MSQVFAINPPKFVSFLIKERFAQMKRGGRGKRRDQPQAPANPNQRPFPTNSAQAPNFYNPYQMQADDHYMQYQNQQHYYYYYQQQQMLLAQQAQQAWQAEQEGRQEEEKDGDNHAETNPNTKKSEASDKKGDRSPWRKGFSS